MEGSSRTLPAGLDPHDLCRAYACALAVSRRDVFAGYSDAFTLDPERQFEEVYFSRAQDEQQFIVAHAKDAVFFGFMGTKVLADYACDMMIDKITRVSGAYHKGIYHRSSCFLGLLGGKILQSLVGLIEQKKRIIFCGHSLGGAVGHMVLTRLLFEDELRLFRAASKSMLSIAFGAPHFCDNVAAKAIEEFPGQFFTFVNENDPVPRLLHDLPRTIQKVALKIKDGVRSRTRVELFGSLCGSLLHFFATGMVVDLDPSDEPVCELHCKSWEEVKAKASDAEEKGSVYAPIGTFVFLRRDSRIEVLKSTSEGIKGFLCDISLEDECFADHRCGSYLRALVVNSLIDAVNQGQDVRGFYHNATSCHPEVDSAACRAVEGGYPAGSFFLKISGKNLFLLREVSLNGVRIKATEVVASTFGELDIFHPLSPEESDEIKRASSLTLVVKTPFGDCISSVVEEFHQVYQSRHVGYLLRKLVLDLVLLDKLDIRPPDAELACLEVILRNFGGMSLNMSLKTILTDGGLEKAEDARKIAHLAASNIMKPLVFEFKKTDRAGDFDVIKNTRGSASDGVATTVKAALVGAIPVAFGEPIVAAATSLAFGSATCSYSVARTFLVWVFNASGWFVCEALDRLDPIVRALVCRFLISDYNDLLKVAVEEVHCWSAEPRPSGDNHLSCTEDDLVEGVNGACESFRAMLRAAFSEDRTKSLKLSTEYLSTATDKCIRQFFRRIYAIVETRNLYFKYVSDKFFVAVVGPEDVGKTSFIQEVVGESVPESEAGIDVHTVQVKPYKLESGLTLVDFPGENGVSGEFYRWFDAFTAMPSIILLLLNFDHDIKKDQIDLYKGFRNRISSDILVVFNKVDKQVESRTRHKYTKDYFSNLRKQYADRLGCSPDYVFFASLSPDGAKKDDFTHLMQVGVEDVQGFMRRLEEFRQRKRNSIRRQ